MLEKIGEFDERFTMASRDDSDLEFKLITEKIMILKVDSAIVVHPVRKAAWSISIREQKKTMYNALLNKKFPDLYRKRIQINPPYNYYFIILSLIIFIISIKFELYFLFIVGLISWLLLTINFIKKRLSSTSRSTAHVVEMIVTSLFIRFLSIYWQFYGALKYRVLII